MKLLLVVVPAVMVEVVATQAFAADSSNVAVPRAAGIERFPLSHLEIAGQTASPDAAPSISSQIGEVVDTARTTARQVFGPSVQIGGYLGGHMFEASPTIPNYFEENHKDLTIADDGNAGLFLQTSIFESRFDIDGSRWLVPTSFGWRLMGRIDTFRANKKFDAQDKNGEQIKSPSSVTSRYAYVAPQLLVRLWALEPVKDVGLLIGYGVGIGYSEVSGRLEDKKSDTGATHPLHESGFGLADTFSLALQLWNNVFFIDAELVHLARRGVYYSSGLLTLGYALEFQL